MIYIGGGPVLMGTEKPLRCKLEGRRWNESPAHQMHVNGFYLARTKVTNALFEQFNPRHVRPPQALGDNHPVVEVMYGEALSFCEWLNEQTGMSFRLPTEPEWVYAAAPFGWAYNYQPEPKNPDVTKGHVFGDGHEFGTAPVDDPRWEPNFLGLDQMGFNVTEFTFGHYRIPNQTWGFADDGMYCIGKGGNYGHCSYTPRTASRFIIDVSDRNPRIGFRLAHDKI